MSGNRNPSLSVLSPHPTSFLILWGLGAGLNALSLLLFTAETADVSAWGYASGWQHEVGWGDLAWSILALTAAREADARSRRFLCALLTAFSAVLCAHQSWASLQTAHPAYHGFWAGLNGFAVAWGVLSLFSR